MANENISNSEKLLNQLLSGNLDSFSEQQLQEYLSELENAQNRLKGKARLARWLTGINAFFDGAFDVSAVFAVSGTLAGIAMGVGAPLLLTFGGPPGWIALGVIGALAIGRGIWTAVKAASAKRQEQDEQRKAYNEAIARLKLYQKRKQAHKSPVEKFDADLESCEWYIETFQSEKKQATLARLRSLYATVKEELNKNGTKAALETLKRLYNEYKGVEKEKTESDLPPYSSLPSPPPVSSETTESIDAKSRYGRNAIMLAFFSTSAVLATFGKSLGPFGLIAIAAIAVLQWLPRVCENYFISKPQKKDTQLLDAVLQKTKNANELELSDNTQLELEETLENYTIDIINDSLGIEAKTILGKTPTSEPNSKEINDSEKKSSNDKESSAATQMLRDLEIRREEAKQRNVSGSRYTKIIGAAMGGLHPIAWTGIAGIFLLALGFSPFGMPILFAGVCVGVGLLAWYVGKKLLNHFHEKEIEAQYKENLAIKRCSSVVEECHKELRSIDRKVIQQDKGIGDLYEKSAEKIRGLQLSPQKEQVELSKLKEMRERLQQKYDSYLCKSEENTSCLRHVFSKPKNPPVQNKGFFSWLNFQNESRAYRDSISVFEKPTSVAHEFKDTAMETEAIGWGGWATAIVMGVLTLGVCWRKRYKVDDPRAENIVDCEKANAHLQKNLTTYKSKKAILFAEKSRAEVEFKQGVNDLLSPYLSTSRPSTPLRNLSAAEDWIHTPNSTPPLSAPDSRSPTPKGERTPPPIQRQLDEDGMPMVPDATIPPGASTGIRKSSFTEALTPS